MIPFTNLLKYLPNIAEVPRDVFISQTSKDTDYKFSSVYSGERDAFLGLDVTVSNESGSTSYFTLDGRQYWVLDSSIRTLTNIPYDTFLVGTTGATANAIDLTFFGMSLGLIRQYTSLSNYEMLYENTVFMSKPLATMAGIRGRQYRGDFRDEY